jgi:6-phosphogluconolactonase (cycloisomerase 2 family)
MEENKMFRKLCLLLVMALSLVSSFPGSGVASASGDAPKSVYVMTNDPAGNAIMVFDRAADGVLSPAGMVPTGGLGTGNGLGSQGALILSHNNRWLFAVNSGSDNISSFEVRPDGLHLVGTYNSNGQRPVSLTTSGDLLYVLNAGGSGNIAGFWVNQGQLMPIPDSIKTLSNGGVGPAPAPGQVQFNAQGTVLVVTERATNLIVTYPVVNGVATNPIFSPSVGAVPFGFDIDSQNYLIISEAQGSAQGTGASSYKLGSDGSVTPISQSVANGQGAACWLVISKNGHFAYTANAATNNLSSYKIANDGSLSLLEASVPTDMQPLDMDISTNGLFLYVIDGRSDTIRGFRINDDGTLASIDVQVPVVATAAGMAAR